MEGYRKYLSPINGGLREHADKQAPFITPGMQLVKRCTKQRLLAFHRFEYQIHFIFKVYVFVCLIIKRHLVG